MIITLANIKGGVAKTTSTLNLAAELVAMGQNVLMVDADPQAGLTISAGLDLESLEVTLYDCLYEDVPASDVIVNTDIGAMLIPSRLDLTIADLNINTDRSRYRDDERFHLFRRILVTERDQYDFVLIDTQPSLGWLTLNALVASDRVIIPVSCDYLSLRGLKLVFTAIEIVRGRHNSTLEVAGILPTMLDRRTLLRKEILAEIKEMCNGRCPVYEPVLRSVRFAEAPISGAAIRDYAPKLAEPYDSLAKEMMTWLEPNE